MCKGAKEDDVVSTCFRTPTLLHYRVYGMRCMLTMVGAIERDSRKDEAIVFIFIFATSGLLAWALFRPWIQKWLEVCFRFMYSGRSCMLIYQGCKGKAAIYSCCGAR